MLFRSICRKVILDLCFFMSAVRGIHKNYIDDLDLDDYEESHAFGEIYESILRELQSAGSSGEFYTPRAVTDFMAKTIKPKLGEKVADFACGTGGFLTSWLNELSKQVVKAEDQQEYATSIYGIEKNYIELIFLGIIKHIPQK